MDDADNVLILQTGIDLSLMIDSNIHYFWRTGIQLYLYNIT